MPEVQTVEIKYEVLESGIHGKGLFATAAIAEGEAIGVYEGPVSYEIDTYVLWVIDEEGSEYGIDGENALRYVNHDAEANAAFYGLELFAERAIAVGEEITHYYGDAFQEECDGDVVVAEGEAGDNEVSVVADNGYVIDEDLVGDETGDADEDYVDAEHAEGGAEDFGGNDEEINN